MHEAGVAPKQVEVGCLVESFHCCHGQQLLGMSAGAPALQLCPMGEPCNLLGPVAWLGACGMGTQMVMTLGLETAVSAGSRGQASLSL